LTTCSWRSSPLKLNNEALKQAIQAETIEGVVRKTIREELRWA
jgi:hypothetical protein